MAKLCPPFIRKLTVSTTETNRFDQIRKITGFPQYRMSRSASKVWLTVHNYHSVFQERGWLFTPSASLSHTTHALENREAAVFFNQNLFFVLTGPGYLRATLAFAALTFRPGSQLLAGTGNRGRNRRLITSICISIHAVIGSARALILRSSIMSAPLLLLLNLD